MIPMKPSNAEWLGDIPEEWNVARIGDFYKLRNEKVSDEDYAPLSVTMKGIVPQLATAAKSDDHNNRKLVKKGDFAINSRSDRRGSCGISPYAGSVSLINTILTPRGAMNPDYYNWLFHTEQFADEFYKWGHGIVDDLWTTRWQEMKSIMIVSPPVDEQQAIANYLDDRCAKIDTIIAEVKASIEEYKELKQAVIYDAITKGLDKNAEMKDSGIEWMGKIANIFFVKKIKYVTQISRGLFGYRPRNASFLYDGPYPFIQTGDVARANHYITEYKQTLSEEGKKVSRLFPKGTLTMTIAANVGDVSILDFDAYFPDSVLGFIPYENYSSEYLYYIFSAMKEEFVLNAISNTQLNLNVERVKEIYIPVVEDVNMQNQIISYLDKRTMEIDELISTKTSLINELECYKKSLIYEVVTGKRKVVD